MNYAAILETYSLAELIELNDIDEEDILRILIEAHVLQVPEILPLEFDE